MVASRPRHGFAMMWALPTFQMVAKRPCHGGFAAMIKISNNNNINIVYREYIIIFEINS
jgi:hypothetical protein